jgi:Flp pilus assembly protein TadG
MVEFALVAMVMLVIVLGIIDFGYLFASRAAVYQATRVAVRYAAVNPTAWSNAASPTRNSIEGNLVLTGIPAHLTNDDSHVTISYLVPGAGAPALCGQYSAASNTFVPQAGYTQATCVVPGDLVQVKAVYVYKFITPLLQSAFTNLTITVTAAALEET